MDVPTPLVDLSRLAEALGVARVWAKDEGRRALGNFKSLGGTRAAAEALAGAPEGPRRLICASDGNHGLAVAAAAEAGAVAARVYLPASVPSDRVERVVALGAEVVRVDGTYDDAVDLATAAAASGDGILIADTTDDLDDPVVASVMAGYAAIAGEIVEQLAGEWPTHLFVQAGVGGLAAAMARGLSAVAPLKVVVVEPASAASVAAALAAGAPVRIPGSLETCATMLACGLASAPAVEVLLACDCQAVCADEASLMAAPDRLLSFGGPETTPSGAAGLAGLLMASASPGPSDALPLGPGSKVLLIVTEARL